MKRLIKSIQKLQKSFEEKNQKDFEKSMLEARDSLKVSTPQKKGVEDLLLAYTSFFSVFTEGFNQEEFQLTFDLEIETLSDLLEYFEAGGAMFSDDDMPVFSDNWPADCLPGIISWDDTHYLIEFVEKEGEKEYMITSREDWEDSFLED